MMQCNVTRFKNTQPPLAQHKICMYLALLLHQIPFSLCLSRSPLPLKTKKKKTFDFFISLFQYKDMPLFVEIFLTFAVALLLSLILSELFSLLTRDDDGIDCRRSAVHDSKVRGGFGWGRETKIGFASELVKVEEFGDFRQEKLVELIEEGKDQSRNEEEDVVVARSEEIEALMCGEEGDDDDHEIGGVDEVEDWEGIERSELERLFGAAVAYVGSKANADKVLSLGSELKLQLYGLHKVAIEGPCLVPQPSAFKVSARAKWNAWHQLGNMSHEVAMKEYINLLSEHISGWRKDDFGEEGNLNSGIADLRIFPGNQHVVLAERNLEEVMLPTEGLDVARIADEVK